MNVAIINITPDSIPFQQKCLDALNRQYKTFDLIFSNMHGIKPVLNLFAGNPILQERNEINAHDELKDKYKTFMVNTDKGLVNYFDFQNGKYEVIDVSIIELFRFARQYKGLALHIYQYGKDEKFEILMDKYKIYYSAKTIIPLLSFEKFTGDFIHYYKFGGKFKTFLATKIFRLNKLFRGNAEIDMTIKVSKFAAKIPLYKMEMPHIEYIYYDNFNSKNELTPLNTELNFEV